MAISDEVKKVANAEATPKKDGAGAPKATAQFKATGAAARKLLTEDQKAIEGSKSDKVAFVCALGDPNKKQDRVEGGKTVSSYTVVGYKFKVLEDTTVPVAPLKEGFKHLADVGEFSEMPVKAGTTVILNLVETGAFISRLEYAGKFSGEGEEVGITAKCSASREVPLPVLRRLSSSGSIKDNMELIADMIGEGDGSKGTPKIKDEFAEKFAVLYAKRSAGKKSAGTGKKPGESTEDVAAAFRAFYAKKQ